MTRFFVFLSLGFGLLLTACGGQSTPVQFAPQSSPTSAAEAGSGANWTLSSPAFTQGAAIPPQYTCSGANLSPELAWTDPPAGTKSLALIVDDPDAPAGTWVHWVLYNLPPETRGLPEGASQASEPAKALPPGSIQGPTSFNRPGYGGPCPPSGQHRYFFHLYAADIALTQPDLNKAGLLKALEGHTLGSAELMGVYKK